MKKINYYSLTSAICILLLITIWRLAELYFNPFNLFFDEAQYWHWGQFPALGYYSKPPMVAWSIWFTTSICGQGVTCIKSGTSIAHLLSAIAIYLSARKLFSAKIGLWSALSFISLPAVGFSVNIISTDPFLLCFWAWSLLCLIYALEQNKLYQWVALGVFAGLGMLSKYAMVVFLPSIFIYYIWQYKNLNILKNPKLWLALLVSFIVYSPNLYWNYQNHFVSYMHTKDNANIGQSLIHPLKCLEFIVSQFAVFGPILFATLLYMIVKMSSLFKDDNARKYRLLMSFTLPLITIMTIEGFLSRANANWAAAAYVSGAIVVSAYLAEKNPKLLKASFTLHLVLYALLINTPTFSKIAKIEGSKNTDFMYKYRGWDKLGHEVGLLMEQHPDATLLFNERKVLTPMLYYVHPYPFDKIAKYNPDGRIDDHYELTRDLKDVKSDSFILISRRMEEVEGVKKCFNVNKELQKIEIKVYNDYSIIAYPYLLKGFKGYDKCR